MMGFIAAYAVTTREHRHYSTISDVRTFQFTAPHAVGLSAFTSRLLATDLSQSRCNFKSQVKTSWHSLIPFLSFLLNHLRLPSPELDPVPFRLLFFCTFCYSASTSPLLPKTSYDHFAWTPRKTQSSVVQNTCLFVRYLAMDGFLFLGVCVAGMRLPARCQEMDIHVTVLSCLLAG
jgi:hypothetical protein